MSATPKSDIKLFPFKRLIFEKNRLFCPLFECVDLRLYFKVIQNKRRTFVLLFCTPSCCSYYALRAKTARFLEYGLVVVEQKCRIAKPARKTNDFVPQIYKNFAK